MVIHQREIALNVFKGYDVPWTTIITPLLSHDKTDFQILLLPLSFYYTFKSVLSEA